MTWGSFGLQQITGQNTQAATMFWTTGQKNYFLPSAASDIFYRCLSFSRKEERVSRPVTVLCTYIHSYVCSSLPPHPYHIDQSPPYTRDEWTLSRHKNRIYYKPVLGCNTATMPKLLNIHPIAHTRRRLARDDAPTPRGPDFHLFYQSYALQCKMHVTYCAGSPGGDDLGRVGK
jgi:hypothetical protein